MSPILGASKKCEILSLRTSVMLIRTGQKKAQRKLSNGKRIIEAIEHKNMNSHLHAGKVKIFQEP